MQEFVSAKMLAESVCPLERNVLMRTKQPIALLSLLILAGCSSTTTQQPVTVTTASPSPASQANPPVASETVAVKPKIDACALLTSNEIEAIQGEAIKETKLSGQRATGFNMSQCFFTLPTFANSVSLLVAQKGEGADARDPKDYWRDTFHEGRDRNRDRDRAKESDKKKGQEEEAGAPPVKVSGVGEEAYWIGSPVSGALYVLKGNAYLRLSVGGPSNQANKTTALKALAQKALPRL
jgi:hypothetical protein